LDRRGNRHAIVLGDYLLVTAPLIPSQSNATVREHMTPGAVAPPVV